MPAEHLRLQQAASEFVREFQHYVDRIVAGADLAADGLDLQIPVAAAFNKFVLASIDATGWPSPIRLVDVEEDDDDYGDEDDDTELAGGGVFRLELDGEVGAGNLGALNNRVQELVQRGCLDAPRPDEVSGDVLNTLVAERVLELLDALRSDGLIVDGAAWSVGTR